MNRCRIYDPVGVCIYCGAKSYIPAQVDPPHEEHIIPYGLGGNLVLPEASCRKCERTINPWETRLMRGALLGCRTYLGLQTRSPEDRPASLPVFDPRDSQRILRNGQRKEQRIDIPISDYPVMLMLSIFHAPGLMFPGIQVDQEGAWGKQFQDIKWEVLSLRYGLNEIAMPMLDTFALCRTLAKIAHSYAIAELGFGGFIHVLPHYIIGSYDDYRFEYVGGVPEIAPPGTDLHEIEIEPPNADQWTYVVVRIRLFASFGAPTYRVIAGRRINPKMPLEVRIQQLSAGHTAGKSPFGVPAFLPIPEGLWDPNVPFSRTIPPPASQRYVRVNWKRS